MHPISTSILLGLTAAAANVFGGAIIVQRHWERRYHAALAYCLTRYFRADNN